MIKIGKLHITITASDCPNLSYQFDFSEFYNKNLARKCIGLFKQFDNYYEVQSSICELQRLRSLLVKNEKEFLILYKVE